MRTKLFLIVLGVVLVLGISPFLLPMAISASEDDDLAAVASENPLRALIAKQSTLEIFYLGWQKSYLARGWVGPEKIPALDGEAGDVDEGAFFWDETEWS